MCIYIYMCDIDKRRHYAQSTYYLYIYIYIYVYVYMHIYIYICTLDTYINDTHII